MPVCGPQVSKVRLQSKRNGKRTFFENDDSRCLSAKCCHLVSHLDSADYLVPGFGKTGVVVGGRSHLFLSRTFLVPGIKRSFELRRAMLGSIFYGGAFCSSAAQELTRLSYIHVRRYLGIHSWAT